VAKIEKLPEGFRIDLQCYVTATLNDGVVVNAKITLGGSVKINTEEADYDALGKHAIATINDALGVSTGRLMTKPEIDEYLAEDAEETGSQRVILAGRGDDES